MKGIILAGGSGTRLYPLSRVVSKQLLPVYDKPLIYYPLSTLMLAGIRDILIISTAADTPRLEDLLANGRRFGINISYRVQPSPDGIAQAFILGEDFICDDACAMILGDNIFYGNGLTATLKAATQRANMEGMGTIFCHCVPDPQRFGVAEFDSEGRLTAIVEKPSNPKSNYVVTGLYFYPAGVSKLAKKLKPSLRGELEITDLNNLYLEDRRLYLQLLGRGYAWMDVGTIDALHNSADFICSVQKNQGIIISSPEEISYVHGYIDRDTLLQNSRAYANSLYGAHLQAVAEGRIRY